MNFSNIKKVILASANQKKLKELTSVLPERFKLIPQNELDIRSVEETGLTFVENAIIKARHACDLGGYPAIADDSGLEVDGLKGAPGIYSSRYASEGASDAENITKLLQALDGMEDRQARFHCAIVFMRHKLDPTPLIVQGSWQGEILEKPVGTMGFGYDPVFYVPEKCCSSAELDPAEKNRISHRAKAVAQLKLALAERYGIK